MEKIKILAITKEGGSGYHRINYPFNKINGIDLDEKEINVDFKQFSEEVFKTATEYDILLYHWDIAVNITDLGNLKSKGVKIIYSIDDSPNIEEDNSNFQNPFLRQYIKGRVIQHILNADAVIVSTERLLLQCKEFNANIAVLPNFLDPKDFKIEKKESEKLRIGIMGSASHISNFLSLKGVINRLAKNKEIVKNCEFWLCGEDSSSGWKEIVKMFKVKKGLSVNVVPYSSVTDYIKMYENLDVCLMPLLLTDFNLCRSSLKLNECAVTNTLPVGSSLYNLKELKGIVVAETPLEYEKTILQLLDRNYFNKVLKYVTEVNLKDADFEKRFKNTKSVIGAVYNNDLSTKLDNIKIYGLKYKEEQDTEYTPVLNQNKTTGWRFEYNSFINKLDEIKEGKEGYYGFLSWKFSQKTHMTKEILYKSLIKSKYEDYDFINLSRSYWKNTGEYLKFSFNQHPELETLLNKILKNLGQELDFKKLPEVHTYSNFFIMKKENWIDYLENWVIPSLNYMENEIWEEVNVDANYKSGISSEELFENTGCKFYNMVTFLLERLIIFYIQNKNLKAISLI